MSGTKISTGFEGIYASIRPSTSYDDLQVLIKLPGKPQRKLSVGYPEYSQVKKYLKHNNMRRDDFESDKSLMAMLARLFRKLANENGLSPLAKKQLELKRARFDYVKMVDDFYDVKKDTVSTAFNYKGVILNFWLPYMLDKLKAEDPSIWYTHQTDMITYLRRYTKKDGKRLSVNSYAYYTTPFDEFMKHLRRKGIINRDSYFIIGDMVRPSLDDKKKGRTKSTKKTYSFDDIYNIKRIIDREFMDDQDGKTMGYIVLLGVCTGLRRGNLTGLKGRNIILNDKVPHITIGDNRIPANPSGGTGTIIINDATKTTHMVEDIKLPLIQPDKDTAFEIASFLKSRSKSGDYIYPHQSPDWLRKWWRKTCDRLGVKYISIHELRHSYATNGGKHMELYGNQPLLLQMACTHTDYRTTQKYIHKSKGREFLDRFNKDE